MSGGTVRLAMATPEMIAQAALLLRYQGLGYVPK
jgi:hypothetical protein